MDRRSEAALRTAVSIAPGTQVVGIGLGSGELARAMNQLGIDYSCCEADSYRAHEPLRLMSAEADQPQLPMLSIELGAIACRNEQFDWVFILDSDSPAGLPGMTNLMASEIVRILRIGGWIWLACDLRSPFADSASVLHNVGCVDASVVTCSPDNSFCYRILRKVDADTPA